MSNIEPTYLNPDSDDKRIYLPAKGMIAKANELAKLDVSFVHTAHSIYVPSTRVKYLNQDSCSTWWDLNDKVILMTPGEIARTELEREFGKPKIWVKRSDFDKLDFPPPQYYDGNIYDQYLYYVDLNAAYWQIYQHLTLDCVWPRGLGSMPLVTVARRLQNNKLARNAVVGITRSRTIWMDTPHGTKRLYFHNYYLNPAIWRTIQSVLHEIATFAIKGGCVYVSTDGYIFSSSIDFLDFVAYLSDYGFDFKTEKGKGHIHGWADYSIGKKKTKVKAISPRPLDKVNREERGTVEWLNKVRQYKQGQ